MTDTFRPSTSDDLSHIIRAAAASGDRLEIRGGGTMATCGAARAGASILDLRGFAGVIDYDPAELVLTLGPGTPLAQAQELVASAGQMLAFDPFDCGPVFGRPPGAATIGGVLAAGISGSLRLSQGGPRDHLLGFKAVSGRGEFFTAGAKVVKNVTGYDLPKLAAGSWGRLFAMTEVTLKVLPAPRMVTSCVIEGLDFVRARQAMSLALGSAAMPAAAAFIPARGAMASRTLFRLQGMAASVAARLGLLGQVLEGFGTLHELADHEAQESWSRFQNPEDVSPSHASSLWRISLPPSKAPEMVAGIEGDWIADWGGGLIWLTSEEAGAHIRALATAAQGHAMLMRAPLHAGQSLPMLHPALAPVAALEQRLRRSFDPACVFETGRFLDDGQ